MKRIVFRIYLIINLDGLHRKRKTHDKVAPSNRLNMANLILRNKPFDLETVVTWHRIQFIAVQL